MIYVKNSKYGKINYETVLNKYTIGRDGFFMKHKLFKVVILSTILILSSFIVSCSNSKSPDSPNKTNQPIEKVKKETIPFRITWTDYSGRGVAIKKIVDLYNKKNTGKYEIALQGGDENITAIENLLTEKENAPIFVLPYRYVEYFGDQGALVDLSTAFVKEKDLFYPEIWKLGKVGDGVYGIPWLGHSICLIYNKGLLKEAGVDPKAINNLTALVSALEAVEAKTKAKGIGLVGANHNDVSWMVNQFVYGFGSKLVDESGKKVAVNNKKAREAIEFYRNTLGPLAQLSWRSDTGTEVMDHFRNQEIAFEFQGVWGITDIEKNGNPFEVGVISLEDIGLYAEVGPMMLSIPKNMDSEKQKQAIQFIDFMISVEAQEKIMDGEYSPEHDAYYPFRVPVRVDLEDSLVFKKYPQYYYFIKGFKRPSVDVPVPKWQIIKDTYYAPGLNKVMKDEITIEDFLKTVEAKGNEVLNKN